MTEVECVRIKVKAGAEPLVHEWSNFLRAHSKEVHELLAAEGMSIESAFLERASDGLYLIYYLRAPSLAATKIHSNKSQHPIDLAHKKFMSQIREESQRLECLIDFNIEKPS